MTGAHRRDRRRQRHQLAGLHALLAKAGKRVLVIERNDYISGAIRTTKIAEPGFVHEVFAAWHPLFVGSGAYAPGAEGRPACPRVLRVPEHRSADRIGLPGRLEHSPDDLARGERGGVGGARGRRRRGLGPGGISLPPERGTLPSACSAPSSGPRTDCGSRCGHTGGSGAGGRSSSPGTCCRRAATGRPTRFRRTTCTGCSRRGCCMPASVPRQPRPVPGPGDGGRDGLGGMPVPRGGGIRLVEALVRIVEERGGSFETGAASSWVTIVEVRPPGSPSPAAAPARHQEARKNPGGPKGTRV